MAKVKGTEKEESGYIDGIDRIANSDNYSNFLAANDDKTKWTCSYGAIPVDLVIGKLRRGVVRIWAPAGCGKTCFTLNTAYHFQKEVENSKVVWIDAEFRLHDDLIERSGINKSPEQFLLWRCNETEKVFNFIKDTIDANAESKEPKKIMYVLDSLDFMTSSTELAKTYEENLRVAISATLNTQFCRRSSLPLSKNGHCCFILNQIRTDLSTVGSYTGVKSKASGGAALSHVSNVVLKIRERFYGDTIWENQDGKTQSEKGKPLGVWVKITVEKAISEVVGQEISYPVRFGVKGGPAIWREYIISDLLKSWDMIKKRGAWFSWEPSLKDDLEPFGIDITKQFHGANDILEFLDKNPKVLEYFEQRFKNLVVS